MGGAVYNAFLDRTLGHSLGVGILNIAGKAWRFAERGANPGGHIFLAAREGERLYAYSISARSIGYRIDLEDYWYAPELPDDPNRFSFLEEVNDPSRRVLFEGSDYHTTSARGSALLLFRDQPIPTRRRNLIPRYDPSQAIARIREIIIELNQGKRRYQGLSNNCSTGTAEALLAAGFPDSLHRFKRFFGLDLPARIFNEALVLAVRAGLDPITVIAHRASNSPRPYSFTAPPGLTLFLESFLKTIFTLGSLRPFPVRNPIHLVSNTSELRCLEPKMGYHFTYNALPLLRLANQSASGKKGNHGREG
jgi:hypothetical protein